MVCYLKHKAGTSLPFLVVGVAQSVRAPGCGPGGRGFDSLHSPHSAPRCRTAQSVKLSLQLTKLRITSTWILLTSNPSITLLQPQLSLVLALCALLFALPTQRRFPEIIRRHEKALIGL